MIDRFPRLSALRHLAESVASGVRLKPLLWGMAFAVVVGAAAGTAVVSADSWRLFATASPITVYEADQNGNYGWWYRTNARVVYYYTDSLNTQWIWQRRHWWNIDHPVILSNCQTDFVTDSYGSQYDRFSTNYTYYNTPLYYYSGQVGYATWPEGDYDDSLNQMYNGWTHWAGSENECLWMMSLQGSVEAETGGVLLATYTVNDVWQWYTCVHNAGDSFYWDCRPPGFP